MHFSSPITGIIWLCFLAVGCFGTSYGFYSASKPWGYGGNLCLFIAILMLKFVAF